MVKKALKRWLVIALVGSAIGMSGCANLFAIPNQGKKNSPQGQEVKLSKEKIAEGVVEEKIEKVDSKEIEVVNFGIGPVQEKLVLQEISLSLAKDGEKVFGQKCSACHKFEKKYVGPALKNVTKRRGPEWILNMIMNPVEMTQKDKVAMDLLAEHLTQMTYQNVTLEEAREILEYFRLIDKAE